MRTEDPRDQNKSRASARDKTKLIPGIKSANSTETDVPDQSGTLTEVSAGISAKPDTANNPLDKLRLFTENLEDSIEKAKFGGGPTAPRTNHFRHGVLREISEQMPSAIEIICDALSGMKSLGHGMRTLNHLDHRILTFEAVDTAQLMQDLIDLNEVYIKTNNIVVENHQLGTVIADRQAIAEIFQAIFDNALKYLHPARQGAIRVSSHQDLHHTTFMFKDNGRGIPAAECSKVFDIFKRAENVVHISGEGMGLPFVQILVRRHSGRIWFETEYEVGSTFYFTLSHELGSKKKG